MHKSGATSRCGITSPPPIFKFHPHLQTPSNILHLSGHWSVVEVLCEVWSHSEPGLCPGLDHPPPEFVRVHRHGSFVGKRAIRRGLDLGCDRAQCRSEERISVGHQRGGLEGKRYKRGGDSLRCFSLFINSTSILHHLPQSSSISSTPFFYPLSQSIHTTSDSHHVEPSPLHRRRFCPCPRSGADKPWERRYFRRPRSNNSHEHRTHSHYRRRRCQPRYRHHWLSPWYRFRNHLQRRSYCSSCSGRCIIGLQCSQRSYTHPRSYWSRPWRLDPWSRGLLVFVLCSTDRNAHPGRRWQC
jgi:hypothetical protein